MIPKAQKSLLPMELMRILICDFCKHDIFTDLLNNFNLCSKCGKEILFKGTFLNYLDQSVESFEEKFWFGGQANSYSSLALDSFHGRPIFHNYLWNFVDFPLNEIKDKTILQICPELGGLTEILLLFGANVIALDSNDTILNTANNLSRFSGNLICLRTEGDFLPVENESLDFIVALGRHQQIDDLPAFLNDAHRCLKRGGQIYISRKSDLFLFSFIKNSVKGLIVAVLRRETFIKLLGKSYRLWAPVYKLVHKCLHYLHFGKIGKSPYYDSGTNVWQNHVLEKFALISTLTLQVYYSKMTFRKKLSTQSTESQDLFQKKSKVLTRADQKIEIYRKLI